MTSSTSYSMSTPDPSEDSSTVNETEQKSAKEQLALPGIGEGTVSQLDVSGGGSSVKLDHLGPMVVNQDGTLSRISNWDQMTEFEKKTTLRVLAKRNKERLDTLKAAEKGKES